MKLEILGVDPRSQSREKLPAPAPLPCVSRRALKRVKDRLVPPTACHRCDGAVRLVSNDEIYGRQCGDWPYAYLCTECQAYVGLHRGTDLPLGIMADRATINARRAAKIQFMRLTHEHFGGNRTAAYQWLSQALEIAPANCHFGMFTRQQAEAAGRACRRHLGHH